MHQPIEKPFVVIGYGSTLRGDDAVGRLVVDELGKRKPPNMLAVSVTQLVPELAALVARASAVAFVDACVGSGNDSVQVEELENKTKQVEDSHGSGAHEILSLARLCFHASPRAWLVTIPGIGFELSEEVSEKAHEGVVAAVKVVESLAVKLHESQVAYA